MLLIRIMKIKNVIILILTACLFFSCSINKMIVNKIADSLSQGDSTVFTGDNDPELIGEALPFALKLYESLLEQTPENTDLLLATGKAFSLYSYGFVQSKAEKLSDEDIDKKTHLMKRAKKLYLRGRDYILRAIEVNHSGFLKKIDENKIDGFLSQMKKDDVPFLYWGGMSWMGAFSVDPFDFELGMSKINGVKMITKALELDEEYENGSIHSFFISYYGSMPEGMGGSEKKAREHYEKALQFTKGKIASPYLNLAVSVCVNKQKIDEFKELMDKVLEIDVDKDPGNRLLNLLAQDKAKWMLEHLDDYFIIDDGGIEE